MSHPAWVCGLKPGTDSLLWGKNKVTPCVGVWIETQRAIFQTVIQRSHPAWVCGLKPAQRRTGERQPKVTPCVGVWIETGQSFKLLISQKSHTLRGCVDWNMDTEKDCRFMMSHPAWVCGLKHLLRWWFQKGYISHTLRGCVDWNRRLMYWRITNWTSHPAWVCGLKLICWQFLKVGN